jgi:hypothetical protein
MLFHSAKPKNPQSSSENSQNLTFIIETLYEDVVFIQARIIATARSYDGADMDRFGNADGGGGEKVTP